MNTSAIDFPALALGSVVALAITIALMMADRGANPPRGWIAAAALYAALLAIGLIDLLGENPRETNLSTVIVGAIPPVLGALGMVRGTRRVRAAARWPIVFAATFVLLFGGLLIGAAVVPRFLR